MVAQHYRDTTQHCTIKISEAHLNTLAQTLISGVGLDFSTAGNSADYAVDVVDRRPEIVDLTSPEPAASRYLLLTMFIRFLFLWLQFLCVYVGYVISSIVINGSLIYIHPGVGPVALTL